MSDKSTCMSVLEVCCDCYTCTCVSEILGNHNFVMLFSIIKIVEFPAHQESQSVSSCLRSCHCVLNVLSPSRHPPNHSKCYFSRRTEVCV